MFNVARIKLTTVYLSIIMVVSVLFSVVIYRSVSADLHLRFQAIERRFEGKDFARHMRIHEILLEDLKTAEKNLFYVLLYIDGFILLVSAVAGFVMAGKTLQPIEDALEEQKRFIADASHEIKTPLTAIKTNIEVNLRDRTLTLKQAKKVMRQNLSQVEELKDLTAGLLTMAKLDQYEEVKKTKQDISILVEKVVSNMQVLAKSKKIKIKTKLAKSSANIESDSVEKLIKILIDNAIKYTDKGKVLVDVSNKKSSVVLKVKDTGVGIAKKDLPYIFDRFYRADTSRSKNNSSGFGLGLCLAKQIVESHNGKIEISSKLGKGTEFKIILPK